ncbi:hypothetical protein CPB86DRAFT_865506, partial [Serendipita vermifera]
TGAALRDRLEQLPDYGPRWLSRRIIPESGTIKQPAILLYKDPLHAIQALLQKPSLEEHMEFAPRRSWQDQDRTIRLYSEMSTGNWWWRTQESLPCRSTVIPVILGSDKAHLTVLSGNKKGWPVYLSIGNIKSQVRNKINSGAWVTIAHIPIVKFEDDPKICGTLQARLFHQCMHIIMTSLVTAGRSGVRLTDSQGHVCHCFPRLAAYIADYPEQTLVNVAAANTSPISIAGYEDLDSHTPLPLRTRDWILQQIEDITASVDPQDVESYTAVAKVRGISGVHRPFWVDLPGYEPETIIVPDILHGCLRFWRDHPLKWIQRLVGKTEFDKRLRVLQPVVGHRHFKNGIIAIHQWTGRDDRELLRVAVAVAAGAPGIDGSAITALRAINDFIYLAQLRSHSDETLGLLDKALEAFHDTKKVFIESGARRYKNREVDGFKIPKLSALIYYGMLVIEKGSCPQYSTDVTERCHQPFLKDAYRSTNRRDFAWQMCRYLDRRERVEHFREFLDWATNPPPLSTITSCPPDPYSLNEQEMYGASLVQPSSSSQQPRSRITLLKTPPTKNLSLEAISRLYQLRDLTAAIADYLELIDNPALPRSIERRAPLNVRIPGCAMDAWERLRIHLPTVQDEDEEGPSRAVLAYPPSSTYPYGRCDTVLIHEGADAQRVGVQGYRVAQIRLIFRLKFIGSQHPLHHIPLVYVQWFSPFRKKPEKDIKMYIVDRLEGGASGRPSNILPLDCINRFVQLIPQFGHAVSDQITEENSMEICKHYYVNRFADKEIYQSVY